MSGSDMQARETRTAVNRRRVLSYFGAVGLGGTLLRVNDV